MNEFSLFKVDFFLLYRIICDLRFTMVFLHTIEWKLEKYPIYIYVYIYIFFFVMESFYFLLIF